MSKRGNPNHDPHTGRFSSGGGGGSNRQMQRRMHRELARRAGTGEQRMLQPDGSHAVYRSPAQVHNLAASRAIARNKAYSAMEARLQSDHNITNEVIAAVAKRNSSVPAHHHFGAPTTTTPKTGDYNIAKDPTRNGTYASPGSGQKFSNPSIHTIRGGRHRSR